jgi:hypothetical protein
LQLHGAGQQHADIVMPGGALHVVVDHGLIVTVWRGQHDETFW